MICMEGQELKVRVFRDETQMKNSVSRKEKQSRRNVT